MHNVFLITSWYFMALCLLYKGRRTHTYEVHQFCNIIEEDFLFYTQIEDEITTINPWIDTNSYTKHVLPINIKTSTLTDPDGTPCYKLVLNNFHNPSLRSNKALILKIIADKHFIENSKADHTVTAQFILSS